MCGIVGYIGTRDAAPLLVKGLKQLACSDYDSAGVAIQKGTLRVLKQKGRVEALERSMAETGSMFNGACIGIGHIRRATHGEPSDRNAHPHMNVNGDIALIHNGVIENHALLKFDLALHGYTFQSETDSEVLVHLIDRIWREEPMLEMEAVVRSALRSVEGTCGLCVISLREPDRVVVACKGSPLVIGVGEEEFFIASDIAPIIEHTRKVIFLADGDTGVLSRRGCTFKSIENIETEKPITELDVDPPCVGKVVCEESMIRENVGHKEEMMSALPGLVQPGSVHLGSIEEYLDRLKHARRVIIGACGSSWNAALTGEYLIGEFSGTPVEIEYASEFRYSNPFVTMQDIVIVISQTGESAETLAALREAKERGAMVMGICNAASPDAGASAKNDFSAQVTELYMLALALGKGRTISQIAMAMHLRELSDVPDKVARIIEQHEAISDIAGTIREAQSMLCIGSGYNFPVALEGALMMREIAGIRAQGYSGGDMPHGAMTRMEEGAAVVFIATKESSYPKTLSKIEEIRRRNGRVIAIANEGDTQIARLAEQVISIPDAPAPITPLLTIVPLHLLACSAAFRPGSNAGRPRNLLRPGGGCIISRPFGSPVGLRPQKA